MKNRIFRKISNFILKAFTIFMLIVCALSIVSLDSDTWIPVITLAISVGWFWLCAWVNYKKWEKERYEDYDEKY